MSPEPPQVNPPAFDEADRNLRLAYLGFDERDAMLLHELEEVFAPRLGEIADRFYAHLLHFEATRTVFRDDAMVQRLKEAQKTYLMQAVRGPYDAVYFERRWRIGYIHNVIGLEPRWFVGAFALYHRILFPYVMARFGSDSQAVVDHILALDKIMALDMIIGLESYWVHYTAAMDHIHALNAKIQAASAAKSQFLANMSHEFRTPLNAIIGFTEVLQDRIAGPLNDEQAEYLADIHGAGQLLLRLVNDVLDIAKIEAGRLELYYETFPIAQVVRDGITTLRPAAEKKGLDLHWQLPPDLGVIRADQIRIKQVLFNLLSNAVKFTDAGGVTVSAQVEEGNLHIMVADTGIGIRPEDRDRIFVEFSQVDASHGRKYEGTGLGLSLSKRLVEAHGGRIWFESEIGRGSVFHVVMPLQPKSDAPDKAEFMVGQEETK
ncbi:MAG: HAMP domain-containing histidine kinase [Burkholderiales bacterium]|nr:HAMP domain-containing histidine kinase [Burkholderiales bacterium]